MAHILTSLAVSHHAKACLMNTPVTSPHHPPHWQRHLADAMASEQLGHDIAQACFAATSAGGVVYLQGDLGAGKTTLVRGLLQALGHVGAVKSPTYTLVEPYVLAGRVVNHFDLYRLIDPEELELIGFRDYFSPEQLTLVEWPSQGSPLLPTPDIDIILAPVSQDLGDGRLATITAHTPHGAQLVARLI